MTICEKHIIYINRAESFATPMLEKRFGVIVYLCTSNFYCNAIYMHHVVGLKSLCANCHEGSTVIYTQQPVDCTLSFIRITDLCQPSNLVNTSKLFLHFVYVCKEFN